VSPRGGVLRLVSALPGITVTHGTVDGQPTLTLTADTGIPLKAASGPAGQVAGTVTYAVTRVDLAGTGLRAGPRRRVMMAGHRERVTMARRRGRGSSHRSDRAVIIGRTPPDSRFTVIDARRGRPGATIQWHGSKTGQFGLGDGP